MVLAPVIGLTSSEIYHDSLTYKTGINFNGGFYYGLMLNDRLNIAIEAMYTGKGVKTDNPLVKYRYYYLDLPLILQIKPIQGFRINIGPQYSKFINSQIVVLDGSSHSGVNVSKYQDLKDQDLGLLLGMELDVTEKLTVAARYTMSSSLFTDKTTPGFGVFNLTFKYSIYSGYQVLFPGKEETKK